MIDTISTMNVGEKDGCYESDHDQIYLGGLVDDRYKSDHDRVNPKRGSWTIDTISTVTLFG